MCSTDGIRLAIALIKYTISHCTKSNTLSDKNNVGLYFSSNKIFVTHEYFYLLYFLLLDFTFIGQRFLSEVFVKYKRKSSLLCPTLFRPIKVIHGKINIIFILFSLQCVGRLLHSLYTSLS